MSARTFTWLGIGLALAAAPALAQDPPARVGRIAYVAGPVSFSPAGAADWAQAPLNRPLVAGDRLWTDAGARDEAQFGDSIARMGAGTLMTVLAADERATQLQVSQGRIDLHVRSLADGTTVEVDTPNLAFVARAPGDYRIAVAPDGATSDVTLLRGAGDVYGDGTQLALAPGQAYRFGGQDLNNYVLLPPAPPDDFDRWALARDQRLERAVARRYVPQGVVGVEDLDDYGSWRTMPDYGAVWVPDRAPRNWAPYHTGHWTWIDPWGWTWVDDQPWGYAVSHYGRWVHTPDTWAWVPAPVQTRPVYAPALVAFVGTALAVGSWSGPGVGWFPLAPHEPYRPPYHASPTYVTNINVTNTVINNVTNIRYVNRNVPGAMVAMPAPQFASAAPTVRSGLVLPPGVARAAPVLVAPQARALPQSRLGTLAGHRPPAPLLQRMAVTRALPAGAFVHADRHGPAGPDARLAARGPVPSLRVLRPALGRQATPQPWHGPAPGAAVGGRQFAQAGQPGGPGARGPQPAQPGQPVHGMVGQVPVARDMRPDHPGGVPQPHRPDLLAGAVPQPGAPGAPGVARQHGRFVPGMPALQAEGPGRPAAPPPGGHPQAARAPDAAPARGAADVVQHGGRTPPQGNMAQAGPHWAAQGGVPTAQASGPMEAPVAHGDAGRAMNRHGRQAAPPQPVAAQAEPQPSARGAATHPDRQAQRAAMQVPQPQPHGPAPQPQPAAHQAMPRPQPQATSHPPAPHPQAQAAPHAPAPRPQPAAHPPEPAPQPAPRPAPHEAPHEAPHPPAQAAHPQPHPQPQPHAAPQHGPDKGGDHGHKKGEQGGH
ncbi:MAG: hypothetical protein JF619_14205 [Massilia sp.]|nr:hypothetical protein [Massilia sp.]